MPNRPLAAGLALAASLSLAPLPAAARPLTSVPAAFVGQWVLTGDRARCGDNAYDSGLNLQRDMVGFYESGGMVRRVRWLDRRTIRITGVSTDDEGVSGPVSYTFRLSPDGQRLTDRSHGQGSVYIRCR